MASPVPFKVFRQGVMVAAFKSPADAAGFVVMTHMTGRGRHTVKYNQKTVWGVRDGEPQSGPQVRDKIEQARQRHYAARREGKQT